MGALVWQLLDSRPALGLTLGLTVGSSASGIAEDEGHDVGRHVAEREGLSHAPQGRGEVAVEAVDEDQRLSLWPHTLHAPHGLVEHIAQVLAWRAS